MHLRNGPHGYGAVTTLLHWLTVSAFAAQLVVGYTMEADGDVPDGDVPDVDSDPPGEDVSGHIAFFVAMGAHLTLVIGKGLAPRMLPGRGGQTRVPRL